MNAVLAILTIKNCVLLNSVQGFIKIKTWLLILFICLLYSQLYTVEPRYSEPERKMKNGSLYREFVKSKIENNREFLLKY